MATLPKTDGRIADILKDEARIQAAMNRGVKAAIETHRQAGVPLVVWREGRVVYLDPTTLEEVPADDVSQTNSVEPHI
jgi:hypothetical protein